MENKNEWKKVKLKDVIEFNPKETLKKGTLAKYVEMANLQCFQKNILKYDIKEYKGGSKFRNGDTLLARITPCLENGKTGFINFLNENEIAFGSTEYIILREKKEITDKNFIYYLAISEEFRNLAIKSMSGTSGRQRVQTDVLLETAILLPPLKVQRKIAKILSDIDEKIELNNKINDNLEKQAQLIFKSWFLDFEPFKNEQPLNWFYTSLGNIADISSGKRPIIKKEIISKEYTIPLIGASNLMGYTNKILYNEPILVIGRVGTLGTVQRINTPCWTSDNTLIIRSEFYEYIFQILRNINYENLNRGSTQPLITQNDLKNIQILLPDLSILKQFENNVGYLMKLYNKNILENNFLNKLKNCLLPKLMNGEIDIEKIEL